MTRSLRLLLPLLLLGAPPAASAQAPQRVPVTLAEAEAQALAGNPSLRAAREDARAADRAADAAGAFRWPGVQASAGAMRTDDPVAVFGAKLRQERFGAQDLDIDALNDPDPVSDWTAGLGARWEVGAPARWAGLDAARGDARAAGAAADRTAEATRYRARLLYLDAVRARGQVGAAQAALEAAEATRDRTGRRRDEGMATDADVLQAEAARADAEARLARAETAVADALDALGAQLGWPVDRVPEPVDSLPTMSDDLSALPADPGSRADVRAAAAAADAARARARSATLSRLPTVAGFAQLGSHAPGFLDDPSANWTVGVEVSVPLFTGFGLSAGADAAGAQARAAEARHEAQLRAAQVQLASARRGLESAHDAVASARVADDAAREAARLLRSRYDEGMTTLSDLLQAEAQAARLRAARVDAEAQLLMARATLDFALGDHNDDTNTTREGDRR